MNNIFNNIRALTLITSESCNLNCAYCKIAETSNILHTEEVKKLRQSFETGEYLNNIEKIFDRFNLDKNQINEISFWGQEPTTTLDLVADEFPHIYKLFPNLNYSFFSTNGVAFYERIIKYIQAVETTVLNPFKIEIQISYDGDYSNQNLRGVSSEIIKNNIISLFKELNNLTFNNCTLDFVFHGVVSIPLIEQIYNNENLEQEIEKYWHSTQELVDQCIKINKNNKIHIVEKLSPGLINSYNASVEDGLLLTKFVKDCLKYNHPEAWYLVKQISHTIQNQNLSIDDINNLIKYKSSLIFNDEKEDNFTVGCHVIEGNFTIRYNGQFMHCQDIIYALNKEEIDSLNKKDIKSKIRTVQLEQNAYPNLLTDSIESINKIYDKWKHSETSNCFMHQYNIIINFMILLALNNQISLQYLTDLDKLYRHAFYILHCFNCWENNLNNTSSIFGRELGQIRFLANGMCDLVDQELKGEGPYGIE